MTDLSFAQAKAELQQLLARHELLERDVRSGTVTPAEHVRRAAELTRGMQALQHRVADHIGAGDHIVAGTEILDFPPAAPPR
ncbi:hypothetical protein OTB20_40540 [Streptomyces sp. H27-H1]|uniref:hypothetical protein n=1 Tax=Streptomyces sp. H27-H1 TaxID=2996461 RepID=UPI002271F4E1|nr:hypothetical protein [Streptomyces sp. H27-H1]MCY0932334.1 hypothetical protein [Streptomyces sp. H27-H1]